MEPKQPGATRGGIGSKFLRWINLRPEESERTLLMFIFYTFTSVGLLWLESSAVGLFLQEFGAEQLPVIYIASSGISVGLSVLYSWLQKLLPLRRVIVLVAFMMAFPLLLFQLGVNAPATGVLSENILSQGAAFLGMTIFKMAVLLLRLWLEAIYVLNDLNASITANQLFNIREVKRTYPLISSGVLVADVVSGFSLPLIIKAIPGKDGLLLVIMLSFLSMLLGASILYYLSHTYRQAFPESLRRRETRQNTMRSLRLRGKLRHYVLLLILFFILSQVLLLLVDFQFLSQLEQQQADLAVQGKGGQIASFLSMFNGALGVCELAMQWLVSSRLIERIGVFAAVMSLPTVIVALGSLVSTGLVPIFSGLVGLKFVYELLHYTIFASVGPVLFQPVPDIARNKLQSDVRGIAEPLSTGATGLALWALVTFKEQTIWGIPLLNVIVPSMVMLAGIWLITVWALRAEYVGLLVLSAERGQLSSSDVDLRELKRAVVEALEKPGTEADKRSCIELLSQIDPKNAGDVVAPTLDRLPLSVQHKSLEVMLAHPSTTYLPQVHALIEVSTSPEVLSAALRYVYLTDEAADFRKLQTYLRSEVDPMVRGTAASLLLNRGSGKQKAEATNVLRQMLTHKHEQERVMGCRALGQASYLQALRIYIPDLLKDKSIQVRRALLEAIASTHLEENYPALLRGLRYKPTRKAAMTALVQLENDALPMLVRVAEDGRQPDILRTNAWTVIGQIGTNEAMDILIAHLKTAWGNTRRNILRTLLKIPQERGIETVLDRLGRSGVEQLIDQELMLIGQAYATLVDLMPERTPSQEAELLRRTLRDLVNDGIERLFLLMKFLYPLSAIQAAAFNLQSDSRSNKAVGLEILDNTLDIPSKRALLVLLDRNSDVDKLQSLSSMVMYEPMAPQDRLRYLLDLRHFLPEWALSCCFHVARQARWRLTTDQIRSGLSHPRGFVREAVLGYLQIASPQALVRMLSLFEKDPDRLVVAQVHRMIEELGLRDYWKMNNPDEADFDFPDAAELEPL
jgi:HEAT repeat protein/ATP/ADP translocase